MDIRDYFQILKKNLAFIIFLAVLGAMIAYLLTSHFVGGERVQKHYLLVQEQLSISGPDGLLIYQEPVDFTDSAVAILETYDFKVQILKNQENLIVKKEAPQVLNLQAHAGQKERADEIIRAAVVNFNEKVADIFGQNNQIRLEEIGSS